MLFERLIENIRHNSIDWRKKKKNAQFCKVFFLLYRG